MTSGTRLQGPRNWGDLGLHAVDSPIQRRDPRIRVLLAGTLAVSVVTLDDLLLSALGLGLAMGLVVIARLRLRAVLAALLALDSFMVLVVALLPFSVPGEAAFHLGSVAATWQGLETAALIALKANAVLLSTLALVGTLEIVALGHALHHLYVPDKLIHLFLFTVRYLGLMHQEYTRLRQAMRARAFRARSDRHTWRSVGYLLGMLLVRSLARSERILAAMKCRGFDGRYHRLRHPPLERLDWYFGAGGLTVAAGLVAAGAL